MHTTAVWLTHPFADPSQDLPQPGPGVAVPASERRPVVQHQGDWAGRTPTQQQFHRLQQQWVDCEDALLSRYPRCDL